MPEVARLGVVGAGQMGAGIAHVAALAGLDVVLNDLDGVRLEAGLATIRANLGRQVAKGTATEEQREAALARLHASPDPAGLGACDLVIEAATEDEAVKARLFAGLGPHLAPHALLASNTSSISITRLAAATDRPERFVGLHFMNPVPMMALVEVIRGIATSQETYEAALALVRRLGKTAAVAEDAPAFLVNRLLLPMINEAVFALHEGVGDVEAIDASMRLGANHPMGPLQLADLIGLDTCLAILRVLQDGMGDPKYRPCPLLVRYVDAGWLGRKAGRGFYDYRGGTPVPSR